MESLKDIISKSLDSYFNKISFVGSTGIKETNKVLLLSLLDDFVNSDFNTYMSEEDFKIIKQCIYCLCDSSEFIDHPEYQQDIHIADLLNIDYKYKIYTGDTPDNIRFTDNGIRLIYQ